ncbi:hypothetical protein SSX86_022367 [Deinandra increscens subsp. villosa]|uniref:HSF-type DNA-binding domain-containing protein n=1 Tax=Deinandra increscens subsp. villosa TaxID=3103831 RepID=A0AAP0CK84_9ASTR
MKATQEGGGIGSGDGDCGLSEVSCGDIEGIGDCGGTCSNGPMRSKTSCLVPNRMGLKIEDNHGVPPFLIKLYLMVDDKGTSSIISWGSSSTTFIISDERRFTLEILPCYFKNGSFDNFISQLNNYGFKKKEWNQLEFEHEHFQEGNSHQLKAIKRKKQPSNVINKPCVLINELKATFDKVTQGQKQIRSKIGRIQYDVEQTLSEVQTITESMTNKLLSTFSETNWRKRAFLDINEMVSFADIKKDFKSISDYFEGSPSDVDSLMTLSDLKEKAISKYGGRGGASCGVPKFLTKLYNMVENEEINDHISWNLPSCDSFIIWDINKFATHVLPMYFKHSKFSSFNSQLNLYGFKKVSWDKHEYANEWFRRGKYDWLVNIKRRIKGIRLTTGFWTTCSSTEVEMFNNQLKAIQHDQENKVILLSNYEEQIKNSVHEFKEMVINMANVVVKMIEKSTEKFENAKKAKLEFEENVIGNEKEQKLEAIELETLSTENNSSEAQSYSQELEIDFEALEKIRMEDDLPEIHGWNEMGFYGLFEY